MQGVFLFLYFLMCLVPVALFMFFMYIASLVRSPTHSQIPHATFTLYPLGFEHHLTLLPTFTAFLPRSSHHHLFGLALWIQSCRWGRVRKPCPLTIPDHVANPSPQPDYATGGECETDGDYQTSERGHESGEPLRAGHRLSRPPPMQVQEQ
jgi:hypothetical protein